MVLEESETTFLDTKPIKLEGKMQEEHNNFIATEHSNFKFEPKFIDLFTNNQPLAIINHNFWNCNDQKSMDLRLISNGYYKLQMKCDENDIKPQINYYSFDIMAKECPQLLLEYLRNIAWIQNNKL